MPFPLTLRITRKGNLAQASQILVRETTNTLESLGRDLQHAARENVRIFAGHERRNIKWRVTGRGLNKLLEVFGDLLQTVVDELGLPPGVFQPFGPGSRIFNYVRRKALDKIIERKQMHNYGKKRARRKVSHVYSRRPGPRFRHSGSERGPTRNVAPVKRGGVKRVAREAHASPRERRLTRIAFLIARSIFERGIRAGHPFERTLEQNRVKIIREIGNAFTRAVAEINR